MFFGDKTGVQTVRKRVDYKYFSGVFSRNDTPDSNQMKSQ